MRLLTRLPCGGVVAFDSGEVDAVELAEAEEKFFFEGLLGSDWLDLFAREDSLLDHGDIARRNRGRWPSAFCRRRSARLRRGRGMVRAASISGCGVSGGREAPSWKFRSGRNRRRRAARRRTRRIRLGHRPGELRGRCNACLLRAILCRGGCLRLLRACKSRCVRGEEREVR